MRWRDTTVWVGPTGFAYLDRLQGFELQATKYRPGIPVDKIRSSMMGRIILRLVYLAEHEAIKHGELYQWTIASTWICLAGRFIITGTRWNAVVGG